MGAGKRHFTYACDDASNLSTCYQQELSHSQRIGIDECGKDVAVNFVESYGQNPDMSSFTEDKLAISI